MSLLVLFSLFSTLAHASFWERKYDAGPRDYIGRKGVATHAGASWITGSTYAGNSSNVLTVKYNEQGTVLWARQWDGGDADGATTVAVDDLGNAYVAGTSWQETVYYGLQPHALLLKYDPNGTLLWSRSYRYDVRTWGGDMVLVDGLPYLAVEAFSDDDLVVTQVLRYSASGVLEWVRYPPWFGNDYEEQWPAGLATDGLGNIYLVGWLYKPFSEYSFDTFVAKFRTDGQRLWGLNHDFGKQDTPWDISASASGVFVTGPWGTAAWDGSGAPLWEIPFTGYVGAVLAHGSSVYVTGTDGRMRTVRYDAASGAEIWTHIEDQSGTRDSGSALAMANGTLFVAGGMDSVFGAADRDLLMVGLDSATGTARYTFVGLSTSSEGFYALATSSTRVWAAGQSTVEGNSDIYLLSTEGVPPLPRLTDLKLTAIAFAGGCQTSTGRITLDSTAPAGGTVVHLTSTNPVAVVPATVTVPEGQSTVTFPITAPAVSQVHDGTVTASLDGVTDSSSLKVRPIAVKSLTLSQNPVTGPSRVDASVFLECPAAPGNVEVKLSSSNAAVASPSVPSITIPAGAATGRFTVSVSDVAATQFVDIRANTPGGGKTVRLQVN
jgi:hypothetical protein